MSQCCWCGGGHGAPASRGHGYGHVASDAEQFKSYGDPDVSNPIPPFTPSRPVGYHFGQPLLRNTMTKAMEFIYLFSL